jgi:hypothetical protein
MTITHTQGRPEWRAPLQSNAQIAAAGFALRRAGGALTIDFGTEGTAA